MTISGGLMVKKRKLMDGMHVKKENPTVELRMKKRNPMGGMMVTKKNLLVEKRNPTCMKMCLGMKTLHPAQCHVLCR